MDLKRYSKTRYQNIYRHKKNKNYMITISKPKTSISTLNGKKIFDIEVAKKVRDDSKIKFQKESEINNRSGFDELWEKYLYDNIYIKKLSYNTYHKKQVIYNKYFKNKFTIPVTKIKKEYLARFIDELDTTKKQKNEIISQLRAFFNWCVENEIIITNPIKNIKKYKIPKIKMKYWTTSEIKKFFDFINEEDTEIANRVKMLVLISFSLGDRIEETRALTFGSFDTNNNKVYINHSINYDPKSDDPLSTTKKYFSQREIDISPKLSNSVVQYKNYLKDLGYDITSNSIIFSHHNSNKPISDTKLRKDFYNYCKKAGVSKIRMYDLRHTYVATMMKEGKELYLFSRRIGHINYNTTVNKYGHLSNKVRKEVALSTDKYI